MIVEDKPNLLCQYVKDIMYDPRDRLELRMDYKSNSVVPCLSKSQYKEGFVTSSTDHTSILKKYFDQSLEKLFNTTHDIALIVVRTLCNYIQYPYTDELINSFSNEDKSTSVIRILRYVSFPYPSNEVLELARDHTDIGLITFMPCSSTKTLEILNTSSQWINVEEGKEKFIVTIIGGEQIAYLSNNFYIATRHRIINSNKNRRISFPFLMRCPPEYEMKNIEKKSKLCKDITNKMY